jgi:hypothetical protein
MHQSNLQKGRFTAGEVLHAFKQLLLCSSIRRHHLKSVCMKYVQRVVPWMTAYASRVGQRRCCRPHVLRFCQLSGQLPFHAYRIFERRPCWPQLLCLEPIRSRFCICSSTPLPGSCKMRKERRLYWPPVHVSLMSCLQKWAIMDL